MKLSVLKPRLENCVLSCINMLWFVYLVIHCMLLLFCTSDGKFCSFHLFFFLFFFFFCFLFPPLFFFSMKARKKGRSNLVLTVDSPTLVPSDVTRCEDEDQGNLKGPLSPLRAISMHSLAGYCISVLLCSLSAALSPRGMV